MPRVVTWLHLYRAPMAAIQRDPTHCGHKQKKQKKTKKETNKRKKRKRKKEKQSVDSQLQLARTSQGDIGLNDKCKLKGRQIFRLCDRSLQFGESVYYCIQPHASLVFLLITSAKPFRLVMKRSLLLIYPSSMAHPHYDGRNRMALRRRQPDNTHLPVLSSAKIYPSQDGELAMSGQGRHLELSLVACIDAQLRRPIHPIGLTGCPNKGQFFLSFLNQKTQVQIPTATGQWVHCTLV